MIECHGCGREHAGSASVLCDLCRRNLALVPTICDWLVLGAVLLVVDLLAHALAHL